jgi:hypothetical protein
MEKQHTYKIIMLYACVSLFLNYILNHLTDLPENLRRRYACEGHSTSYNLMG